MFFAILLLLLDIIFMPFAVLWAVNEIFQLGLVMTGWIWVAIVVLGIYFRGVKK